MPTIGNVVFDNGLSQLNTSTGIADALHINSQEPTTYTEAVTTYTLGHDNGNISISGPTDRAGGGREVTSAAISGGTVTGTNTATHWSIVDTGTTDLMATGTISPNQSVTSGNSFSLTSFTIGIPDPA